MRQGITKYLASSFLAFGLLVNASALAHGDHCHKKTKDGKLTDWKEYTEQAACEGAGGIWEDHDLHCHKKNAQGKLEDFFAAKTKKACLADGGTWTKHDHASIAH